MKTIRQTQEFNSSSENLFDILLNAKRFAKITGGKASNSAKAGGEFSIYDEYIQGVNEEITEGKKIVQKWECADFPKGHNSRVTIEIKKNTEKTSVLELTHENVPDELAEDINILWNDLYWEPIRDYLEDQLWG